MAEKSYDAIVVGSGANGGWAAKELCEAGFEVAVLEAGRELDPATDFSEHTLPHELPLRGRQDPRRTAYRGRQGNSVDQPSSHAARQARGPGGHTRRQHRPAGAHLPGLGQDVGGNSYDVVWRRHNDARE